MMTATIHPFHRTGSGGGPRSRAFGRVECVLHPADLLQQSETLRQTRQHIAEAWELRAESRRIQRDYEERQRAIERLLDGLGI
jgi:hypothetical protein